MTARAAKDVPEYGIKAGEEYEVSRESVAPGVSGFSGWGIWVGTRLVSLENAEDVFPGIPRCC